MANTKIPAELSSTPGIIDNSNATAITIDSSENVGIGTGSPTRTFEVNSGTANAAARFESTDSRALIEFKDNAGTASIGNIGTNLTFFPDNATEALRIDSSGNLLVGTTVTALHTSSSESGSRLYDGGIITAGAGTVAYFNRNGAAGDGTIIDFRKSGSPVGSIGTSGDLLYMSSESGAGFRLVNDDLRPASGSSNADASYDLGHNNVRWRNLYLSGGVLSDGVYLGGTGAANKLDDYEEGTWTAELKGSTGSATTPVTRTGTYTKVGNLVHVQVSFVNVNTTGASGSIQVTGLPFTNTSANSSTVTLGQYTKLAHSADSNPIGYINPSANLIQMSQFNDSAVGANWFITATTGVYFYVSATYTI